MLRIAMVEDNIKEAEIIKEYIQRFSSESNETFEIVHFLDAVKFLDNYSTEFDIIFMDIEMPKLNGMEAARKLRKIDSEVILIFITNMVQFAVNGYDVAAYDFIVKPVLYNNFIIKLKRAVNKHKMQSQSKEELSLPFKMGIKRIAISSIKHIEVRGHHLFFYTFDETIDVVGNMNSYEERLKNFNFSRCNSCYLVNLKYVTEIKGDTAIVNKEEIQISRRKRKSFIDELTVYMGDN